MKPLLKRSPFPLKAIILQCHHCILHLYCFPTIHSQGQRPKKVTWRETSKYERPTFNVNFNHTLIMFSWALTFFILAVIAGLLGFTGIAGASAGIAQILFFVFLVLLVVSFAAKALRGKTPL